MCLNVDVGEEMSQCGINNIYLIFSDRLVHSLDTIVPFETTKAYDMLDIVHAVNTHT